jgi:hypothetical protein
LPASGRQPHLEPAGGQDRRDPGRRPGTRLGGRMRDEPRGRAPEDDGRRITATSVPAPPSRRPMLQPSVVLRYERSALCLAESSPDAMRLTDA